jgi:N-acetylneuraminate synthase
MLIKAAKNAGCDLVKFQKRTIDLVYSKEELDKYRESPWGTTNREQKYGLEFGKEEYDEIDNYCKKIEIDWFASAWDLESQKFLQQYNLKYNKIASAMLTYTPLLEMVAKEGKYTFISTGMSTLNEVNEAVKIFRENNCLFELMACNSSYPCPAEDSNLNLINSLQQTFHCKVGYSSHSVGIIIPVAAAVLGATSVEVHISLDRSSYGSDQSSSIEIGGLKRMIEYIRTVQSAIGNGLKIVTEKEQEIKKKLRKY